VKGPRRPSRMFPPGASISISLPQSLCIFPFFINARECFPGMLGRTSRAGRPAHIDALISPKCSESRSRCLSQKSQVCFDPWTD
jgi:hypothetical protein